MNVYHAFLILEGLRIRYRYAVSILRKLDTEAVEALISEGGVGNGHLDPAPRNDAVPKSCRPIN